MKRLLLMTALVGMLGVGGAAAVAASHTSTFKRTLCHRTLSAKKPYVKITVSTKAAFRGHLRHPADIWPVPAGGCPKVALTPTQGGTVLTAALRGSNEVPPADPDGTGTATFRMIKGAAVICFTITVKDIVLPATGAHIHQGTTGVNGNVVVPLKAPDASGSATGCVNSSRTLVAAILANPGGYYANVHTTDYPNGAIRGQLAAA
jgi:CHRD domain